MRVHLCMCVNVLIIFETIFFGYLKLQDSFAGIEDDDDEFFDTDDMQTKKSEKSKKKNGTGV